MNLTRYSGLVNIQKVISNGVKVTNIIRSNLCLRREPCWTAFPGSTRVSCRYQGLCNPLEGFRTQSNGTDRWAKRKWCTHWYSLTRNLYKHESWKRRFSFLYKCESCAGWKWPLYKRDSCTCCNSLLYKCESCTHWYSPIRDLYKRESCTGWYSLLYKCKSCTC